MKTLMIELCIILIMMSCQEKNSAVGKNAFPAEDHYLSKYGGSISHNDLDAYMRSLDALHLLPSSEKRTDVNWKLQGPGNIGARVNTIAVHPNNADIIYLGFSEGGVFRTKDGGVSWVPIFDEQSTLSIGSIEIDPNFPDIIYVGTGDPNVSGYPFIGNGIYKSVDGGDHWKYIGLSETRIISDIKIDPKNSQVLYVGTMGIPFEKGQDRGLYKSINGGNSWEKVLYINDSTGISNVVINAKNSDIIYASTWNRIRNNKRSLVSGPDGGVFRSIDGGHSWERLVNGLPQTNNSRVGIDISVSDPNILYACIANAGDYNIKGIYKTEDGGDSWQDISLTGNGFDPEWYAGFGWYFTQVRVNPKDPNDVFVLAVDLYRTKDGGQNWEMSTPPWWFYDVHADKHDLRFAHGEVFLGTDGGAYKSYVDSDFWEDIENIPTTQFYRVATNPHKKGYFYGGAQDNGTSGGNADNIFEWPRIFGGDGFQPIFHPVDSNVVYVTTQNGNFYRSTMAGESFENINLGIDPEDPTNWDAPLVLSSVNPDIIYTGTNKVYKAYNDQIVFWHSISPVLTDTASNFYRHDISALDAFENIIVAGTSDGLVWISQDTGATWTKQTALPHKYVSDIKIKEDKYINSRDIVVTFSGFRDNDNTGYIYETNDGGQTWTSLQGNLPSTPINTVERFKYWDFDLMLDILVIGTNSGVYWSWDDRQNWSKFGNGFPNVAVYDVLFDNDQDVVVAGTFGRGIYTIDMTKVFPVHANDILTEEITWNIRSNIVEDAIRIDRSSDSGKTKFAILSSSGQEVLNGSFYNSHHEINVSNLTAGIYFVKIDNKSKPFLKY